MALPLNFLQPECGAADAEEIFRFKIIFARDLEACYARMVM
jgi:hypothetical protein